MPSFSCDKLRSLNPNYFDKNFETTGRSVTILTIAECGVLIKDNVPKYFCYPALTLFKVVNGPNLNILTERYNIEFFECCKKHPLYPLFVRTII